MAYILWEKIVYFRNAVNVFLNAYNHFIKSVFGVVKRYVVLLVLTAGMRRFEKGMP